MTLSTQFEKHGNVDSRPGAVERADGGSGIVAALLWAFLTVSALSWGQRNIHKHLRCGQDCFLQRERKKSVFEKYLCLYLWKQPQTDLQSETEMLSSHDQDGLNQVRSLQHS